MVVFYTLNWDLMENFEKCSYSPDGTKRLYPATTSTTSGRCQGQMGDVPVGSEITFEVRHQRIDSDVGWAGTM